MIGTSDEQLIKSVSDSFARDNEALMKQLTTIGYYFRGHLTRDDVWSLTPIEREKYTDWINKRFEDAAKMMKAGVTVFI